MSKSSIFKDRSKLSPYYIPEELPHRTYQAERLRSIYSSMLDDIDKAYPRVTQIVGDTGTGKTCTTIKFGETITNIAKEKGVELEHVYINCKVDGSTRYVLYGNLTKKVIPQLSTRSLSPEEMLHQLIDYLKKENKFLLICLDEIDYFIRTNRKEHVIYDLTRIPEMHPGEPSPIIGVIFISRSLKWHERLDAGERSTLGMGVMEFPGYTEDQIRNILEHRIAQAFNPNVIEEDILKLISGITANPPVNGDIRVGLDLLFFSGNLAESTGARAVLPDHVRKVYSETNPTITTEDIMSLDQNGRMILLSLVRSLQTTQSAYVGLREVRESYNLICEESDLKPVTEFEEYVQDLICRGIVDMKSLAELGISGASLIDLEKFLDSLMQRLSEGFDKE